ncbi:MAG: carboxylesterase family protein [Actinobacteria bacterium]|nr:carboxylesterase family protein [Actinomycetota bacterium]
MAEHETIELDSGPVSGTRRGEVTSYLGIPYASPPVGGLRWKPPQPVAPWTKTRPCNKYGPACPQVKSRFYDVGRTSEECLHLNVWVPERQDKTALPVLVWLHGGGFTTGAGSLELYKGTNLASRGFIVVTLNYRVGPLGFLSLPELSDESTEGSSGNYGLMDQIAALQWVQSNIEAFGGDRECVTLFGESAGAVSICFYLLGPAAENLFQHAIVESAPLWISKILPAASVPLKDGEETGLKLASKLDAGGNGNILSKLRAKTAEEIVAVTQPGEGFEALTNELQFGPVIDGRLLPGDPVHSISRGNVRDLPLLIGANAREANLFLNGINLPKSNYEHIVEFMFGKHSGKILELFPAGTDDNAAATLSKLFTVNDFIAPARFLAGAYSNLKSNSFLYHFSRSGPGNPMGACHGVEMPYVFGNFNHALGFNDVDFRLSETMMSYWTSFARTGNPNCEDLPEWPAYSKEKDELLRFSERIEIEKGLCGKACDLAEEIKMERMRET